jgi:anti-sigma regulatory factor (Ser/Thr protein kinase)
MIHIAPNSQEGGQEQAPGGHGQARAGYRHEALLYAGEDEFMEGVLGFVRAGVAAREPMFVVVAERKLRALRHALNGDVDAAPVLFADMDEVGANPARIIPAWQEFLERHAAPGRRVRGVGEPVCAERTGAELAECHRHEELLNVAFHDADFTLMCPYDVTTLAPAVVEEARRTHPFVRDGAAAAGVASARYPGLAPLAQPSAEPLPEPRGAVVQQAFDRLSLGELRRVVRSCGAGAGMDRERVLDFVLAANEVATNSVVHGGGGGVLRIWRESATVVCEVRDGGRGIADPLAGRRLPGPADLGGRGLWLANQVGDLVQLRVLDGHGVVRVHMRVGA